MRKLLVFVIALTIAITGIVQPAYAAPGNTYTFSNQGNGNSVYINDSFQGSSTEAYKHIGKSVIDGIGGVLGAIIGTAAICFAADAVATAVFPPTAALAPFCPAIRASVGGAGTVARVVIQH